MQPVRAFVPVVLFVAACTARPPTVPAKPVACVPHTWNVAGACVPDDDARDYCGKAAAPAGGGCAPGSCAGNGPLDLASGECVPMLKLKKLALAQHIDLKEEGALGCSNPEASLAVEGETFACLPAAATCGRGAGWSDGACRADPPCPEGSVLDPTGACVWVMRREGNDRLLDVGTWVRLVIGPDGGNGSSAICGPLLQRPWLAGVVPHGRAAIGVRVDLVFPDNDVHEARVTASARKDVGPHAGEAMPSIPVVARQLEPVWKALRALGGMANAASATVEVRCTVEGGSDAISVPRSAKDEPLPSGNGKPAS